MGIQLRMHLRGDSPTHTEERKRTENPKKKIQARRSNTTEGKARVAILPGISKGKRSAEEAEKKKAKLKLQQKAKMLYGPTFLQTVKQRNAIADNMKSLPQWFDLIQRARRWYVSRGVKREGLYAHYRKRDASVSGDLQRTLQKMCRRITKRMTKEEGAEYFNVLEGCLAAFVVGKGYHKQSNLTLNEWGYHAHLAYPQQCTLSPNGMKEKMEWSSTALNKKKYAMYKEAQIKGYEETIEKVAKNLC